MSSGCAYNLVIYIIVKLLDRISDNDPVPEAAIQRYKIGVARALRILQGKQEADNAEQSLLNDSDSHLSTFDNNRSTATRRYAFSVQQPSMQLKNTSLSMKSWVGASTELNLPISVQMQSQSGWMNANKILEDASITDNDTEDSDQGHDSYDDEIKAITVVSKDIETAIPAHDFKSIEDLNMLEDNNGEGRKKQNAFLRTDIVFHPDGKDRFWYNSINVMGTYAGLAMYSCLISDVNEIEFVPTLKWCAALYATGITFSLIVSATRAKLLHVVHKDVPNYIRLLTILFYFTGLYTYGPSLQLDFAPL